MSFKLLYILNYYSLYYINKILIKKFNILIILYIDNILIYSKNTS